MKIDFNNLPKDMNTDLHDKLMKLCINNIKSFNKNYSDLVKLYGENVIWDIKISASSKSREDKIKRHQEKRLVMSQEEKDEEERQSRLRWFKRNEFPETDIEYLYSFISKNEVTTYIEKRDKDIELNELDDNNIYKIRSKYSYKEDEVFHFFNDSNNNPFSFFNPVKLYFNKIEFKSVFQYLMYRKAESFLDRKMMAYISKNESISKLLEIKFEFFNELVWRNKVLEVLDKAFNELYKIDIKFKSELIETKGKTIVYANEKDSFLGIGLNMEDEKINQRSLWKGKNHLGEFLTVLRVQLTGEY